MGKSTKNIINESKSKGRDQTPRYLVIVKSLINDIESDRYSVGDYLPGEIELSKRFSVSRFTIRQAIRKLRDEGIVQPRQGVGTVVSSRANRGSFNHSFGTLEDILQYAEQTYFQIDSFEPVKAGVELAEKLSCRRGLSWFRAEGFRYFLENQQPLCWVEAHVLAEFDRLPKLPRRLTRALWSYIEEYYQESVLRVDQRFRAVSLPEVLARKFGLEAGAPALEVRRVYTSERNRPVVISLSHHPGDRYQFSASMLRNAK